MQADGELFDTRATSALADAPMEDTSNPQMIGAMNMCVRDLYSGATADAPTEDTTTPQLMGAMNMCVNEEPLPNFGEMVVRELYSESEFTDEITGLPLPKDGVLAARADELNDYAQYDVFEEVDEAMAWTVTGKAPVGSRWKDINKGDAEHVQVRSRLIATQVKRQGWESVFTACPPWCAFRLMISSFMTMTKEGKATRKLLLLDIKRAFLNTPCRSDLFVTPPHLKGTGRTWRLKKSMYGTLTASSDFQHALNEDLREEVKLQQGTASPCCYRHAELDCALCYHGDDIVIEGEKQDVEFIEQQIGRRFTLVRKA
eukprot:4293511-Amphidinium_carterae.1